MEQTLLHELLLDLVEAAQLSEVMPEQDQIFTCVQRMSKGCQGRAQGRASQSRAGQVNRAGQRMLCLVAVWRGGGGGPGERNLGVCLRFFSFFLSDFDGHKGLDGKVQPMNFSIARTQLWLMLFAFKRAHISSR